MPSFLRVTVAALVTLAVSASAFAGCLPEISAPAVEMACCKKGQHDCGPVMQAAECCASNASTEKFVATKPGTPVKPTFVLTLFQSAESLVRTDSPRASVVPAALASSSPPGFLLVTSLRI